MLRKASKAGPSEEIKQLGLKSVIFAMALTVLLMCWLLFKRWSLNKKHSLIQQIHTRTPATLKQIKRNDAVFDVYLHCSIENAER